MADPNFRRIKLDEGGKLSLTYFLIDQCLYKKNKTRGETVHYVCSEGGCQVGGKFFANGLFARTGNNEHNHEGHRDRAEYLIAFEKLRDLVRDRLDRGILDLFREVQRELRVKVGGQMNWENIRGTLQRIRNRATPPCKSIQQLIGYLEDEESIAFQQFGRLYEQRLYVGSVLGQPMFANMAMIDELPGLVELYIDGTFQVVPFASRQLLVVMAELFHRPRPIFYAIMKSQTTVDYEAIFNFLQDVLLGADRIVISVMKDFEQSIRAAATNVWPQAESRGCNFHHNQALRKNARGSAGLTGDRLGRGTIHNRILLMFMRISLLPLDRIVAGFTAVLDYIEDRSIAGLLEADDFDIFIQYYTNTWLGRFPPALWCVSDEVRRTNNHVEGHNRKIKLTIKRKPNAWEFLIGIKDLMIDASIKFERDRRTDAPPPRDLSRLSAPLEEALERLNNGNIDELEFLKIMAAS